MGRRKQAAKDEGEGKGNNSATERNDDEQGTNGPNISKFEESSGKSFHCKPAKSPDSQLQNKGSPKKGSQTKGSENKGSQTPNESFNIDEEFKKLFKKAKDLGLTKEDFKKSDVLREIDVNASYMKTLLNYVIWTLGIVVVVYLMVLFNCFMNWPISNETLLRLWFRLYDADVEHENCAVYMPETMTAMFRPPVECGFCEGVAEVETVYNITQELFEERYAYSGVPVVIGDGTFNWTAPKYFSFQFFKELYKNGSQALENHQSNCQFFPYKTEFRGLGEVLEMSPERARMEQGAKPWYVGWSNCDFATANILRKHYQRPYFLPRLSESSRTDWIFMGSPGYGAHMHIDAVDDKPSWQAQITGTKTWTLEPPPECYFVCGEQIKVTVHPGQIIVLNTNIWYHSTLNVGDDVSICIGSEYD